MSEVQKRVKAALEEARRQKPPSRFDDRRVTARLDAEHFYKLSKVALELGKSPTGFAEMLIESAVDDAWTECGWGEIDEDDMDQLLAGPKPDPTPVDGNASGATKVARIVELHKLGLSRAEIAEELGIRYQHVRNELLRKGLITAKEETS